MAFWFFPRRSIRQRPYLIAASPAFSTSLRVEMERYRKPRYFRNESLNIHSMPREKNVNNFPDDGAFLTIRVGLQRF